MPLLPVLETIVMEFLCTVEHTVDLESFVWNQQVKNVVAVRSHDDHPKYAKFINDRIKNKKNKLTPLTSQLKLVDFTLHELLLCNLTDDGQLIYQLTTEQSADRLLTRDVLSIGHKLPPWDLRQKLLGFIYQCLEQYVAVTNEGPIHQHFMDKKIQITIFPVSPQHNQAVALQTDGLQVICNPETTCKLQVPLQGSQLRALISIKISYDVAFDNSHYYKLLDNTPPMFRPFIQENPTMFSRDLDFKFHFDVRHFTRETTPVISLMDPDRAIMHLTKKIEYQDNLKSFRMSCCQVPQLICSAKKSRQVIAPLFYVRVGGHAGRQLVYTGLLFFQRCWYYELYHMPSDTTVWIPQKQLTTLANNKMVMSTFRMDRPKGVMKITDIYSFDI